MTISPRQDIHQIGSSILHVPIHTLIRIQKKDEFIVCCRTNVVPIISSHGKVRGTRALCSSYTVCVRATRCQTLHVLPSGGTADFVAGALSYSGKYYYGVTEDHYLYCYALQVDDSAQESHLVDKVKVSACFVRVRVQIADARIQYHQISDTEVIRICAHPKKNILCVLNVDGAVQFYLSR